MEDFVPWVPLIFARPLAREEEEDEEDEMADLVHNEVPASSGRLMLPPRWLVRLINTYLVRIRMCR